MNTIKEATAQTKTHQEQKKKIFALANEHRVALKN